MADQITIQSIHPEAKQAVVVFNIEGATYPKVLPFLSTTDANVLKTQLKAFAQELRGEFDALKKAVEDADANAVPPVSDEVNALVGQPIDVDAAPTDPGTGDNTGTPADGAQTPAA